MKLTAEYDLRYFSEEINDLETYLLSNQIYWPPSIFACKGENPYPEMTLGWLLLYQLRLRSLVKTDEEVSKFVNYNTHFEDIRNRWRSAWGRKAKLEYHNRLNLWRDYLDDYRHNPCANYNRYAYEVNRRVLLQLLSDETNEITQEEIQIVQGLDQILSVAFIPGDFIWDPVISSSFPGEVYWYLYGTLSRDFIFPLESI